MTEKTKLEIKNLNLAWGERIIFRDLQLQVFSGHKVIIVGENGVGKTTLLKMIKSFNYSAKSAIKINGTVGYLPQTFESFSKQTVGEYLFREINNPNLLNLWEERIKLARKEWEKQFNSLGGFQLLKIFSQLNLLPQILERKFASLSGGEKVKIHLAVLSFQNHDILLLDEPTNHLDEAGLIWLEKILKNHSGIIIMVTHDRYLINQTANYISELSPETHNLIHFHGNYHHYLQEKERQYQRLKQRREQQEKEIKSIGKKLVNLHIKKSAYVIDKAKRRENKMSFDARGARNQKSHSRIVNQLKNKKSDLAANLVAVPLLLRRKPGIDFTSANSFPENISLQLQNISKSYPGKTLFQNLSLVVQPGDKLVIKGANGTGKSTLCKIIRGLIKADSGKIIISESAKLGFLDQEQETMNLNQTVIELLKTDPLIKLENQEINEKLAESGIFYPQELTLPLSQLSIGCRRKVQLVQIILQGANVLILDEPTNHIDLPSLEKIEEQLINFPGPILAVSHDRYFIQKVANQVLKL